MKPKIGCIATCAFVDEITAAIGAAGGIPVLIPINIGVGPAEAYAQMIDGLLVPGGEDVTPALYGQDPRPQVVLSRQAKDDFELALIHAVKALNKPIFGICRGLQILNVALGGTLIQDIPSQVKGAISHRQLTEIRGELFHRVKLEGESVLRRLLPDEEFEVNSLHHQGIEALAEGLRVTARSADGLIEGIESADGCIYAVQWHPECLFARYPHFLPLFTHLVELSTQK